MKTALVVGNAPLPPPKVWRPWLQQAGLVVAADGGLDRARRAGIRVDWLVGDMDSVGRASRGHFPAERVVEDSDPDRTDLEKVFRFLSQNEVGRVVVMGASGARLDHALAALALLERWGDTFEILLLDDMFSTRLVRGVARVRARPGTAVSLMSLTGASGVTTKGLRFPLRNARLAFSPLGVHNEMTSSVAEVRVRRGRLLLMVAHDLWAAGRPASRRRQGRKTAGRG